MYTIALFFPLVPALALGHSLFDRQLPNYCAGNKADVGYCTITSFTDVTTSVTSPPTPAQCQDACRGVTSDAGDWGVDFRGHPNGYIDTMVGYPCTFSVGRGAGEPLDYQFSMTNQDIIDIIDEVSKRYGSLHDGKVAGQGTMVCEGHQATWYVN